MTAPDPRHTLALMRLARAVQDYRACLHLPDFDSEKAAYVREAHKAMMTRLTELEALPDPVAQALRAAPIPDPPRPMEHLKLRMALIGEES